MSDPEEPEGVSVRKPAKDSPRRGPARDMRLALLLVGLVLLAVMLGWSTGARPGLGAGMMFGVVFVAVLVLSPDLAPVVVLLAAFDFLGFVDPKTFGRIPGIFKLRDLLLMSTVLVAWVELVVSRRESDIFRSVAVRAAMAYGAYVVGMILYTVAVGHSSLNLALRVAAPYFYYLCMIPVMAFVNTTKRLLRFLGVLLVVALMPEVLSLFQILTHRPLVSHAIVLWMQVGGLSIPRSYVLSFNLTAAALLCLFGAYLYAPLGRVRLVAALSAVAMLAGVVLTFGRAFWMATIGSLLFLFVVAAADTSMRAVVLRRALALWLRIGVAAALAVIVLAMVGREASLLKLSSLVGRRFVSTFSEFTEIGGTFGGRIEEGAFRLALFRQNPVAGAGYVHRTSEFASELPKKDVGTADSGAITVLAQSGVVGVVALAALVFVLVRRGVFVFRSVRNPLLKGISLGIVSFYIHSIISFAGLTGIVFTHYAGICTLGLLVGLQEVLLRIDGETLDKKNPA